MNDIAEVSDVIFSLNSSALLFPLPLSNTHTRIRAEDGPLRGVHRKLAGRKVLVPTDMICAHSKAAFSQNLRLTESGDSLLFVHLHSIKVLNRATYFFPQSVVQNPAKSDSDGLRSQRTWVDLLAFMIFVDVRRRYGVFSKRLF